VGKVDIEEEKIGEVQNKIRGAGSE